MLFRIDLNPIGFSNGSKFLTPPLPLMHLGSSFIIIFYRNPWISVIVVSVPRCQQKKAVAIPTTASATIALGIPAQNFLPHYAHRDSKVVIVEAVKIILK